MTWNDLERSFLKAWESVFSRKKVFVAFIALSLSGLLFIFCKALAIEASSWMRLSLLFLPILLSSVFLLVFGTLLIRIYAHENRGLTLGVGSLFSGSMDIAIGTSSLSFPPILAYLCLWICLGVFFLLKEIPFIGPFFNIIFAFGPFLLIVGSLLLCLFNVCLLFFMAPAVAKLSVREGFQGLEFSRRIWISFKARPFLSLALFFIGALPGLLIGAVLSLAAMLTNVSFSLDGPSFALALEWFFVMLPFSALLSPAIVFFFQFAAESHQHLHRQ
jgi:hypothetical protein